MKSFFDVDVRAALLERVQKITPDSRATWGKMNAEQMLTHLVQAMRMAIGELACEPKKLPIRFPPLRELIVYVLPWPKGSPTAPELIPSNSESIDDSKRELARLADAFAGYKGAWPEHPAFGRLSRGAWGVLVRRHIDHHLRQFGV
ncbi:MAG TPA: DUF1569 domain-containing protein [Thermoanaerobaculia bacterium]|nr:DUF1569 domain-containing protein [Thermoanaerobaculia bacterium]